MQFSCKKEQGLLCAVYPASRSALSACCCLWPAHAVSGGTPTLTRWASCISASSARPGPPSYPCNAPRLAPPAFLSPPQLFAFLVGFILVFRSNLAYARFWEGRSQLQVRTQEGP